MSYNPQYHVLPHNPNRKTVSLTESERSNIKGLSGGAGFSLWLVSCIVISFLLNWLLGSFSIVVAGFGAGAITIFVTTLIKNNNVAEVERKKTEEANRSELRRVTNEAGNLTSSLTTNYQSSIKLAGEVSNCLREASLWLQTAEREYQANAFAPFGMRLRTQQVDWGIIITKQIK